MKTIYCNTENLKEKIADLKVGDKVYLSGIVYTARDAAHKEIFDIIKKGGNLPFSIKDSVVYYAGPTPTPENSAIGSCGPTTSLRMDPYAPALYDMGMICTIGKGPRSDEVINSIIKNKGIYLCAIGGCGALASEAIIESMVIAFEHLGCESIKRLKFNNFPLIVGVDSSGGNIFKK